jgi:hypothetical protein
MVQRPALLLVTVCVCVAAAFAASGVKQTKFPYRAMDESTGWRNNARWQEDSGHRLTDNPSLVGTYTTLSGFYDYQVNGGACQHVRVNPTTGDIHVVFMSADDSLAPAGPSRSTYYAYSSNAGATWNNFGNVRVPNRRSGFPSLDLAQGAQAGYAVVANHNDAGTGLLSFAYIEVPIGSGIFIDLPTVPPVGGDEPIWPNIAGPSDGSAVMVAAGQALDSTYMIRTTDFSTWGSWSRYPPPLGGAGAYPVHANSAGRVGILLNTSFGNDNGIYWLESTNNGASWPGSSTQIYGVDRIAGADTFSYYLGSDFVYNGNTPYVVISEVNIGASDPTDGAQITFWSQATGFVVAATKANTPGVSPNEHVPQINRVTMDMPVIGMSGGTIVIVYQAMMNNDTSAQGYNNNDLFLVRSTNAGITWTSPVNITNTPGLDERWPSMSPWNEPGNVNLTWQEDTQPGTSAPGATSDPGSLVVRVRQKFLKLTLTDVPEGGNLPAGFNLSQNYPNPFNPMTKIDYTVGASSRVSLKVYNLLGQEVATLIDQQLSPGSYQATFDGSRLSSGVYIYKMTAGSFEDSKKLVIVK